MRIKTLITILLLLGFANQSNANEYDVIQNLINQKEYSEALVATDNLIKKNPDEPKALFLRASILEETGYDSAAILIYEELTIQYPHMPEPFNNLAIHYANNGNYDLAVTTLEAGLQSHESYAAVYHNLQSIYNKQASDAYRKALGSQTPSPPLNLASITSLPNLLDIDSTTLVAEAQTQEAKSSDQALINDSSNTVTLAVGEDESSSAQILDSNSQTGQETNQTESVITEEIELVAVTVTETPAESEQSTEPILNAENDTQLETQSNSDDAEIVLGVVNNWAQAWADQDLNGYLAYYSGDFLPRDNLSLDEWKEQRRGRLLWREFIIIELSDISVAVNGNNASAKFTQYYKSNIYEGTNQKTLILKEIDGSWFITEEVI